MSGSVPAASSATNVPGTNVPPISFPGISSGIDYNSIITQLTSLTLEQNVQPNTQIATLNAANLELIKINSMLASVQNALTALSQPSLFDTYDGTSSNTNVATAQGIPSVAATPGTYVIDSATLATASQQVNSASAGHKMTDLIGGTPSDQVPLANSYAAVTPSNGSGSGPGKVTIDGVTVNYDVTSQSLQTIFSNIQTAVRAVDPTFTIGYGSGDTVQVSGSKPITLGSAGDQGNLLSVLKLDQAPINNSGPGPYTVNGTSGIGGINQATSLNAANGAGYVTPVTSGTFTINGVQISVNTATDNTASVLAKINGAGAGVVANYDAATNQITLTATSTGPQSIVLGSSSDTSNFLSAAGLTTAGGAPPQTIGTQAQVVVQTSTGPQTYYSNSNQVTNAIPGMQINLQASTAQPFTVTVSQDSTQLVSAINTFVSAYNTAINEINQATAPPVVISANSASLPGTSSAQSLGGGILFGNADVGAIKDQLETMASGIVGGNGTSYNSLSQIGLNLDDSFTMLTSNSNGQQNSSGGSNSQPVQSTTVAGTSGQFQPLNVAQLQAALAANPSAIQNLFNGSTGVVTQIGSYLTTVTGVPTSLSSGLVGSIPTVSVLQGFENSNQAQIQSLQQQVQQTTDNANQQADMLRQEFVGVESTLAGLQSEQQQIASMFK